MSRSKTPRPRPRDTEPNGGRGGHVRIIGGLLKRTPVAVTAHVSGMRPTPDRVRETLFNWLGPQINTARCLDLFAGSGALGLEAASRGAPSVNFNEVNSRVARVLEQRIESLRGAKDQAVRALAERLFLSRLDALVALERYRSAGKQFDLVFLDPPFSDDWLPLLKRALPGVLADRALIYLENPAEVVTSASSGPAQEAQADTALSSDLLWRLERLRYAHTGQVHYHLFEYRNGSDS